MNTKNREKLQYLTKFWYDYVGLDHHKDRDCHWYIEADFAYGGEPIFTAYHYGYVGGDLRGPSRTTYDEAEGDLIDLIETAVEEEKKWAREVLGSLGTGTYERVQIEKAKRLMNT